MKSIRALKEVKVNPSCCPPAHTTPNLNPTHPGICQVLCCRDLATAHHSACKIQPPSARCSRHTLVACKEATSCRCSSLDTDPPVTNSSRDWIAAPGHQPPAIPPSPIPTSNRFQPLADPNPNPPEFEAEKIVAARVARSGGKQYYVR